MAQEMVRMVEIVTRKMKLGDEMVLRGSLYVKRKIWPISRPIVAARDTLD